MSDMSQAQGPAGGDPLDLVGAGSEDDVLPGPPADLDEADQAESETDVDPAEESGEDVPGRPMEASVDPSPEGGATLDPPDSELTDEDPGTTDLESGADPMPDMSGTTPS